MTDHSLERDPGARRSRRRHAPSTRRRGTTSLAYDSGLEVEARSQWTLCEEAVLPAPPRGREPLRPRRRSCSPAPSPPSRPVPLRRIRHRTTSRSARRSTEVTSSAPTSSGRDYFSRVLYGIRTSERVAFLVAILAVAIGTPVGALAGYYSRWADNALMRFTDLILTLPASRCCSSPPRSSARAISTGSPSSSSLLLWTASRASCGASSCRFGRRSTSMRPKPPAPATSGSSSGTCCRIRSGRSSSSRRSTVGGAILLEAYLSFLGFGVQPPTPALGKLIADGQNVSSHDWWLVTFPGLTIVAHRARASTSSATACGTHSTRRSGSVPEPVLLDQDLDRRVPDRRRRRPRRRGISYDLYPGETLGVVGESGSGKSVSMLVDPRPDPAGADRTRGGLVFKGASLIEMPKDELRRLRGGDMAMIFQDPMTSLNPVLKVGFQIDEAIEAHNPGDQHDERAGVGSSCSGSSASRTPSSAYDQYPHEFSGGMRQRAMIAMAIANQPSRPHRRRADDGARRDDPGADHRGAEDGAARDACGDDPDHTRPRPGRRALRSRDRHVRRPHRGVGDVHTIFPNPRHPYTIGLMESLPGLDGRRTTGCAHPGPAAEPHHPAARLRVPSALLPLERTLAVPDGDAGAAGSRRPAEHTVCAAITPRSWPATSRGSAAGAAA